MNPGGAPCPSWPGGVAARSRETAQQPKPRRRGGCSNTADLTLDHHPVCGVKELSRLFLDAAATPPGQEGQGTPCGFVHSLYDRAVFPIECDNRAVTVKNITMVLSKRN